MDVFMLFNGFHVSIPVPPNSLELYLEFLSLVLAILFLSPFKIPHVGEIANWKLEQFFEWNGPSIAQNKLLFLRVRDKLLLSAWLKLQLAVWCKSELIQLAARKKLLRHYTDSQGYFTV